MATTTTTMMKMIIRVMMIIMRAKIKINLKMNSNNIYFQNNQNEFTIDERERTSRLIGKVSVMIVIWVNW